MSFTIHGARPHGGHTVEIDEYVPLTIQWPGYARLRQTPQTVVLDVGASLVEVKTDRDSGEVVELVLVDMGRLESSDTPLLVTGTVESGIPLLSYDESTQDDSVSGVHLHSDGLRVRFRQERTSRSVGDEEAVFGFSETGGLVEFEVRLGLDRMAELRAVCGLG
ncbi:hypothetical protein [Streptomyces pactum]|uniref:Uncharacterized protein n=1 Tax=Streptomyces pactum TaxID=68249 RepID=A0A1S6JIQ9_9ACTN|nr:hypothetical protein [Streptomyces pactum]AQS65612.1 hypothetical protein B1H29_00365 [Streptomyces pactum]AQS71641.1 hypothetical protein B1H29_36695 [Streptomyces pactum]